MNLLFLWLMHPSLATKRNIAIKKWLWGHVHQKSQRTIMWSIKKKSKTASLLFCLPLWLTLVHCFGLAESFYDTAPLGVSVFGGVKGNLWCFTNACPEALWGGELWSRQDMPNHISLSWWGKNHGHEQFWDHWPLVQQYSLICVHFEAQQRHCSINSEFITWNERIARKSTVNIHKLNI